MGDKDSGKAPKTLKEMSTRERGTGRGKIIQEKGIGFSEAWKHEAAGFVGSPVDLGVAGGEPAKWAQALLWMAIGSQGGT